MIVCPCQRARLVARRRQSRVLATLKLQINLRFKQRVIRARASDVANGANEYN